MALKNLQRMLEETTLIAISSFLSGVTLSMTWYASNMTITGKILIAIICMFFLVLVAVLAKKFTLDLDKSIKSLKTISGKSDVNGNNQER